jgi:uncharacterized membrane protein
MHWIPDSVGWLATALFAVSYFFDDAARIRKVQAAAASFWMGYGLLIHSLPVIVANLIVVTLALYTAWRQKRAETSP